jgi:hypothetical protein
MMEKPNNLYDKTQSSDSMQTVDQGLNLFPQTINNATSIDKGNDGKIEQK